MAQQSFINAPTGAAREPLRALVAEALLEMHRHALAPGEGLWVEPEAGVQRGHVIIHPDCDHGDRPKNAADAARKLRKALKTTQARKVSNEQRWRILVDSPFAPMDIDRLEGPPGKYPLDLPFIWGSISLSRLLSGRLHAVSTQGGVYSLDDSEELMRLISMSEGVERLSQRGIRPDVWLTGQHGTTTDIRSVYGWTTERAARQRRAYCYGLDLVTNRPALIPYEAVVVELPKALYPEGVYREPFYSGGASHSTFGEAVVNATVELLYRDAHMINWYRRRRLRRVRWPKRPSKMLTRLRTYLEKHGMRLEIFDATLDVPLPTFLLRTTATRSRGNWPRGGAILCPSGAFSSMHAIEHCLKIASGQTIAIVEHPAPIKNPLDPAAVARMTRLAAFWPSLAAYLDPANSHKHAFLGQDGEIAFEDLPDYGHPTVAQRLNMLGDWFRERSLPWLAVMPPEPVARAAGFHVAKVVIPGLIQMAMSRNTLNRTMPRLHQNWPGVTGTKLNPDTHPLW